MPTFVKGDMWSIYGKTDLFLVTTNPIVNRNGELVMGRGIAKQMADRFPGAAKEFAIQTAIGRTTGNPFVSTLYYESVFGKQTVGYFMVKAHWKEPAKITIIMQSTAALIRLANRSKLMQRIDLNFPGIGNGKLDRDYVKPLLDYLPDNVYIWEYE